MLSTKVKRPRMERIVTRSANYANFVRKTRLKSWHMLHRLKGDRRGTTAVESALTANAFLLLVFLMFEAAWMMTIEMAMNDAAQEASRLGSLGTLPATGSREDAIKAAMVTRAAGLLASANLTITMQSYGGAYNYGHHAANATQTPGPGSSRQLVQYVVAYAQPLLTPFATLALGGRTSIAHNTTIMVQNEPF
jgi:Flp pilus assembly protein TadG